MKRRRSSKGAEINIGRAAWQGSFLQAAGAGPDTIGKKRLLSRLSPENLQLRGITRKTGTNCQSTPNKAPTVLLLQQQLFWALVWSLHIKMDETF